MSRVKSLTVGQVQDDVGGRRPPQVRAQPRRLRWEDELPLRQAISWDGRSTGEALDLDGAVLVGFFRYMLLVREFDARMVTLQRQGRIGFYVGALGEEATIVGTTAAVEPQDWLFPCYREHIAAVMRGMPLATLVCNMLGNRGDLAHGRQMPCHEAWRPGRFASVSAPIATQLVHAVGAACAARIRGDDVATLTWFGEGATSASDFHVAMNFAGTRKAPVIFACRNNGWAISTPRELQTASETIAQKAVAYGVHAERVDGNDVLAVYQATRVARARAVRGEGPTLLELVTYRVGPHTTSDDPRAYRADELVEPWRKKDPLDRAERFLLARGLLSEDSRAKLSDDIRREVEEAVRVAEAHDPRPSRESLFEDVYATPLRQQREQMAEMGAMPADG